MKTCPVCQGGNPQSGRKCLNCGTVFPLPKSPSSLSRGSLKAAVLLTAAVAVLLFGIQVWKQAAPELVYHGTKIREQGPDFSGREVPMQRIEVELSDGYVEVPITSIEKGELVQFTYRSPSRNVPVVAYIGPTGRLITAIGYCEPCESSGYHFESNTLFCDKCKSSWMLEGDGPQRRPRPAHMSLAGNCRNFGPEFIEHTVVAERVRIARATLDVWVPRQ